GGAAGGGASGPSRRHSWCARRHSRCARRHSSRRSLTGSTSRLLTRSSRRHSGRWLLSWRLSRGARSWGRVWWRWRRWLLTWPLWRVGGGTQSGQAETENKESFYNFGGGEIYAPHISLIPKKFGKRPAKPFNFFYDSPPS